MIDPIHFQEIVPIVPPKAGRPPRHPVDILRTRLWFHVVKLVSGLSSAYAVELELEPESVKRTQEGGVSRPRKWDFYENGNRVPKRIKGKQYAVDVAEARFPGTAAYFESPIWRVLRREVLSKEEIDSELRRLSPPIAEILLEDRLVDEEKVKRFLDFNQQSVDRLVSVGTFEALAAVVLLIAKSERIASLELRTFAQNAYLSLIPVLEQRLETAPFMRELCRMIDLTCKHWAFVNTQSRMDIVIFSDEMPRPGKKSEMP